MIPNRHIKPSIMHLAKTGMLLLAGIFAAIQTWGQDIHFSQFNMSPLIQNPAMAGAASNLESTFNYRSQWKSVTVPYKTYAAGVHGRFIKRKSQKNFFAAGANFFYDEAGDGTLKTTSINLSLAYHIRLNKINKLGLGFMGGYGQRRIDLSNFQWGSQYTSAGYNSSLPSGENVSSPTFSYLDFASGIVWSMDNNSGRIRVQGNNYNQGTLGFSVFHFNKPDYSFDKTGEKLWIKYVVHGNYLWSIEGSKLALNPGFLFYRQGPNQQILFGSQVRYDILEESKYTGNIKRAGAYLGAYYRTGDALIISGMIEVSAYSFGFSYDANMSNLRPATNGRGGFEFSIRYTGDSNFFGKTMQTR